jgi:Putative peptidoglycan binding domain
MGPLTVLTLISTAVQVAGSVKGLLDQGGVTIQSLQTTAPQIIPQLASIGAALFPKVAPEMQVVAAASATFDPNVTKWLQAALNKLVTPSPNLTVDGVYGPATRAPVEAAQKKLGLIVDEWAGDLTQGAIQTALSKL